MYPKEHKIWTFFINVFEPTAILASLLIKRSAFFCNYFVGATLSNKTTFEGSVKKLLEAGQPSSGHYLHPLVALSGCDLSETLSSGGSLNIDALCPGSPCGRGG